MKQEIVTLKIPYTVDESGKEIIKSYRQDQSPVYHCAYVLAQRGLKELEIRHTFKEDYNFKDSMDSWFIQSAIRNGVASYKADKTLGVTKRIFGGKNNFLRRMKGLISREEYLDNKLEPLYVIGEGPKGGNRKFEFHSEEIIFKPRRGVRVALKLPKLRGKYHQHYSDILELATSKSAPITISLTDTHIHISYQAKPKVRHKKVIKGRYLGVDLNPNYIGLSIFDENKKLLETKLFNFSNLTGKHINHDKLKHEIREVAITMGKMAIHYQIEYLFVEDLSFKPGNKGIGRNFNRLTNNQFLHKEFTRMLSKYGKVVAVNAAYTSTIGNILHNDYPDPIAASMEVARRGIENRVVKGGGGKFYPPLVSKEHLSNRWKEAINWEFETWIELHELLKKTGLKYRVPVPDIGMFRLFSSESSNVLVL